MTNHEAWAELTLQRYLASPEGPEILRAARHGLRSGQWDDEYVAAVGQHALMDAASWPEEQVAAFAEVHALVYGGSVATALVDVGEGPRADADRAGNAGILSVLPAPFRASVDMRQHGDQGDGTLTWDRPVRVSLATGLTDRAPGGVTRPHLVSFEIPPGSAVLEIGSSLPSRTLAHLVDRGGSVARWPYGCDRLRLMVNLDESTMIGNLAAGYMAAALAGL